jgi:hypothetical protein
MSMVLKLCGSFGTTFFEIDKFFFSTLVSKHSIMVEQKKIQRL